MCGARIKGASLTFRGFEIDPLAIEQMFGVAASERGLKGEPVRLGASANLKRSFVRFFLPLEEARLDQVVPALIDHLGGIGKVISVRQSVGPEFFEINVDWPVKSSDEQEGGFLPPTVISDLEKLRCTLTFAFL